MMWEIDEETKLFEFLQYVKTMNDSVKESNLKEEEKEEIIEKGNRLIWNSLVESMPIAAASYVNGAILYFLDGEIDEYDVIKIYQLLEKSLKDESTYEFFKTWHEMKLNISWNREKERDENE